MSADTRMPRSLGEQALELRRETHGADHKESLSDMAELQQTYLSAGRFDEALRLDEQYVESVRRVFGPEHVRSIRGMFARASLYNAIGRYDEAIRLWQQTLELCRETFGPEHGHTSGCMNNLSNVYREVNRKDEALRLREQVLEIRRDVRGSEHPATLDAMSNLANSYVGVGRKDEALKMREQVWELRRKVLGPEHPDALTALLNLALSYKGAGRKTEALQIEEELLDLERKVLGPEHPDTLRVMFNLAISYHAAGRKEEALQLWEELLKLRRKVLGPKHPDTLKAMNNLAVSFLADGRKDEGLELSEQSPELSREVLGPEHPLTFTFTSNLVQAYNEVGRVDEAMQLGKQLLGQLQRVLGPSDKQTSETRNRLARYYRAAERWADAAALQRERIALASTDGEVSSLAAETAALLVLADDKDGYRKLRGEMLQRFAGTDQPEIADRVTRMSLLLKEDGDHVGQVLDLVQRALERTKDEKVAFDLHMTSALAAFDQGDTATAAEQFEQVAPNRDLDLRLLLKCLIHLDHDEWPPSRQILLHLTAFHEGSPPSKRPTAYHLLSHRIWVKAIDRWDLRPLVRWAQQVDDWVTIEFSQTTCSNAKVQFEQQDDGSYLLVGEADDHETYTLTWSATSKRITALRFEQLCDDRLPQSGPGRDPIDGRFRVSDLTLEVHRKGQEGEPKTLVWQDAIPLEQDYPHRPAYAAIDKDPKSAWGSYGPQSKGKPHTCVFTLAEPVDLADDEQVVLTIRCESPSKQHVLGRFRLSATDELPPNAAGPQNTAASPTTWAFASCATDSRMRRSNASTSLSASVGPARRSTGLAWQLLTLRTDAAAKHRSGWERHNSGSSRIRWTRHHRCHQLIALNANCYCVRLRN